MEARSQSHCGMYSAQYGTLRVPSTCMYCYCAVPVQRLVGWAAIFRPLPIQSTVAWRPVPRRRMPRDATRPSSRSDSSSCAIRCRLLEVWSPAFLFAWHAVSLALFPGLQDADYEEVGRLRDCCLYCLRRLELTCLPGDASRMAKRQRRWRLLPFSGAFMRRQRIRG